MDLAPVSLGVRCLSICWRCIEMKAAPERLPEGRYLCEVALPKCETTGE